MNSIVSNIGQVQEIKASGVVGVFKAIAPRSFEKTFDGIPTNEIVGAMKICISGLTRQQIDLGLNMVRDNGFCPDPAMFRKWCLGITGFGTEQQRAAEQFKGKHAALANIVSWRIDQSKVITNAEREAYDRSFQLFQNLDHVSNYERASFYAYEAFKDNYVDVVQEFVRDGITQDSWNQAKAIEARKKRLDRITADRCDWADIKQEPVSKEEMKEHLAKLKALVVGVNKGDAA